MSNFEGNWVPPSPQTERFGTGEYARFWRRFAAHILDQVSMLVVIVPLGIVGFSLPDSASLVWSLVSVAAASWLLAKWTSAKGGSPWRVRLGVLVLDAESGAFLTMERALQRTLFVNLLGAFTPYLGVLGLVVLVDYLWMLRDPRNQTLHDKIARSVVVDRR